jgi:CHAT domain-containing protein
MRGVRKSFWGRVWLGVLALFLVTGVIPSAAPHPPQPVAQGAEDSVDSLLDIGRNLYEAGRFSEAAEVWKQAAANFERMGDETGYAWSLSYLSLAYQNLGRWEEARSAIGKALNILQRTGEKGDAAILAQALNAQGNLRFAAGETEAALNSWVRAEKVYAAAKDEVGVLGSEINQAQALQTLGLYRRSQAILAAANARVAGQQDSPLKAYALRSLGVALQVTGSLRQSQEVLAQSLEIAKRAGSPADRSDILFSLGNTARDLQQNEAALDYYQKAAETATSRRVILEALLNQFSLYVKIGQHSRALALLTQIEAEIAALPASRMSVYAAVNFADSLKKLAGCSEEKTGVITAKCSGVEKASLYQKAARVLAAARGQAQQLEDLRAEAIVLTELGSLYEKTLQGASALTLTQKALAIAQGISASDIASGAAWQMGRLLKQQGDASGAIAAYGYAVSALQSLRSDLVAINPNVQFNFRESVEPVYRELVGLLLQSETPSQKNIKKSMEVIESLQIAELDNFFREACLDTAKRKPIDQIDSAAAVIYPIILPDRLEVILSLPGQPLRNYKAAVPQVMLEEILGEMRQSLNPAFSNEERLKLSRLVYGWLVEPASEELRARNIKTLVFVLDGSLRNLPMAALHDGKQYLVEKYSVALSQGWQLLEPRSIKPGRLKAITAGLSQAVQGFRALPGVESEVAQISSEVSAKVLLNQEFTDANLKKEIGSTSFPVLHLATHGQFSSNAEDTFILTWDGRINVRELDELLRSRNQSTANPVELLVLSACQTAKGDSRAALGLAGVAVRSGARSTLATLWAVRDQSTAGFMAEFYKQLSQPGVSRAEAVRQAQLALLKQPQYAHPFYWAPFLLVGNWM